MEKTSVCSRHVHLCCRRRTILTSGLIYNLHQPLDFVETYARAITKERHILIVKEFHWAYLLNLVATMPILVHLQKLVHRKRPAWWDSSHFAIRMKAQLELLRIINIILFIRQRIRRRQKLTMILGCLRTRRLSYGVG